MMKVKKQSIAVIGSGVTGLSASWLLKDKYDITLFEKNDYLGGHTHTHDLKENDKRLAIDSGFIVYNEKNYPNLIGLFGELDVKTQATDMSFAFSKNQGELEYAGSDLFGMFAQKSNIFSPKHWSLLKEIVRFNKVAHAELLKDKESSEAQLSSELSLGDFLKNHNFTEDLQQNYLLPMGAAIWSCPVDTMSSFPAHSFLQFFENHGLIDLVNRPQWRTVIGGSRQYIIEMMKTLETAITIRAGADSVKRTDTKVEILCSGQSHIYDQVIFACHADQTLSLLSEADVNEKEILGSFKYEKNTTYLHNDESLMPKRKKAWCSWNYLAESGTSESSHQVTATYWMNKLQNIEATKDYFVTLNPYQEIDSSKVIKIMNYEHPIFDREAMSAQLKMKEIQGKNNSWFCGSYTGYGFHEDALSSSVAVCEQLGVIAPWNKSSEKEDQTDGILE